MSLCTHPFHTHSDSYIHIICMFAFVHVYYRHRYKIKHVCMSICVYIFEGEKGFMAADQI